MKNKQTKILFEAGIGIAESNIMAGNRDGVLNIAKEGTDFAEELTSKIESDSYFSEIACGPNCPYCCSMQIRITTAEALLLGDHVLATYSPDSIIELRKRIDRNLEFTDGKSQKQKVENWHLTPCVFLESGSCSLYKVRPFICRSWHSLDSKKCLKAYEQKKENFEIEHYPHRNIIFGTIRKGIIKGCENKGLQSGIMVITKAVKSILDYKGDAVTDWLSGKRIFNDSDIMKI